MTVSGENAAEAALRPLVGQRLVLRHYGDRKDVVVKPGEARKGTCDSLVEVKQAVPAEGGARLTLATLGRVRVEDRPTAGPCKGLASMVGLSVKGVDVGHPETWRDFLGTLLQTPEAYLDAHGRKFTLTPGAEPKEFADRSTSANDEGRRLARKVTAWPKPVLAFEPAFVSTQKALRQEGQIDFSGIVGADGRIFQPKLTTSLDEAQEETFLSMLALWRFEPAREGDKLVPARWEGRTVLRLY
jgi:hypothetical protein